MYPGFDTLGTLEYIAKTGHDYPLVFSNAKVEKQLGDPRALFFPRLAGAMPPDSSSVTKHR